MGILRSFQHYLHPTQYFAYLTLVTPLCVNYGIAFKQRGCGIGLNISRWSLGVLVSTWSLNFTANMSSLVKAFANKLRTYSRYGKNYFASGER